MQLNDGQSLLQYSENIVDTDGDVANEQEEQRRLFILALKMEPQGKTKRGLLKICKCSHII